MATTSRLICRYASARKSLPSLSKVRIIRPYSSTTNSQSGNSSNFSPALTGGLIGGSVVFIGGYAFYHFSGAKSLIDTARQTRQYIDSASQKFKDSAPEPNEALEWLRQTSTSYVAFIPGAKGYVDSAFNDLDTIRGKHGDKVDKIIKDAYTELKDLSQDKGMTLESAEKAWAILQKHLKSIGDLAGDAASDVLDNHPEIKSKVGKDLDRLKQLGDRYGPEAQKQVDRTWEQIKDIIKSGISTETVSKIRSVIEEKKKVLEKLTTEAWNQGTDQLKPYLDKTPQIKALIEKNADKLKQGNVLELWDKVRESAKSGDSASIESYITSAVAQVTSSTTNSSDSESAGGGISNTVETYLKKIPGASDLVPKLTQLQQITEKHGKEAEGLLKETLQEVEDVLKRKMEEARGLVEKGKEAVKKGDGEKAEKKAGGKSR